MNPRTNEGIVFNAILAAALAGERCPQLEEFPHGTAHAIYKLADAGKIIIETYAHNWRVVEIAFGPHIGRRTKACPHNHNGPWRVRDMCGARYPKDEAKREKARG